MLKNWSFTLFLVAVIVGCEAIPKYEKPSSNHYHTKHLKPTSFDHKQNESTGAVSKSRERIQRLGTTLGYSGINSFPTPLIGLGAYAPARINLVGAVFSTLLGIGAILIFPKLLTVFSGGDSAEDDMNTITRMLTNIDRVLGQNNINSTNCMQRAVCAYMRSTESRVKRGSGDLIDQLMHTLSSNSLVGYVLNGTSVKDALEHGKEIDGKECDTIYLQCPLDLRSTIKIFAKLMPGGSNSIAST